MIKRTRMQKKPHDTLSPWSIADSMDLYGIERWSQSFFSVNESGHVYLRSGENERGIDLKELVDEILLRGVELPVLIRFTDILHRRMEDLVRAFSSAMTEHGYKGDYRPVYPIKVNQHRHVLDDIMKSGRQYHFGLECGSRAELLLATALHNDPDAVIICNGFKDQDYVEIALAARRLGHRIFLVADKFSEIPLILRAAQEMKVEPLIGIRLKLASRGKGMWEASGGEGSKFGLSSGEIIESIQCLRRKKKLSCLQLLHFHIGSQITDIQVVKEALREAMQMFVEVRKLGAPVSCLDVGGGLAVDYDGSHTNFASSANYGPREYAADVVDAIVSICNPLGIEHPTIITECGRALVAHHSVLVVEAISTGNTHGQEELPSIPGRAPQILTRMREIRDGFTGKNFQEIYHDAVEARREALMLFSLGHLSLEHRALMEKYFWKICRLIRDYVRQMDYIPDELEGMEGLLAATYFCNFSLFQSLPDHWALKQLFPVIPLHRLNEKPTVKAIIADVTCDSDGVMDRFVDLRDVSNALPLHPLEDGKPYYIGIFLTGAYQEILGDLHNLFGDTNVVHVSSGPRGYVIDRTVEGERVEDVIRYVQFTPKDLLSCFREQVENALRTGAITLEQSALFFRKVEEGLDGYTYLHPRNKINGKK